MSDRVDVAIVGFGFSGLAVLSHLVRTTETPLRVAVIAESFLGHGLAYGTHDSAHLLNVPAKDMGAKETDKTDFASWLDSPEATAAAADLDVALPGEEGFAARRLFAAYLDGLRRQAAEVAALQGTSVLWVTGRAEHASAEDGGWVVSTDTGRTVAAAQLVLATGNEPSRVFGDFSHERLFAGPWALSPDVVAGWTDPVAVVGTSLTAVDAVLSLRHAGFEGAIRMVSRGGLLPEVFDVDAPPFEPDRAAVDAVSTFDDLQALVQRGTEEGFALAQIIQGLRPDLPALWQRLSTADQRRFLDELLPRWNRARHRMAPEIARVIAAEVEAGSLEIVAVESIEPDDGGEGLHLAATPRGGERSVDRVAAIIDCSGTQLDPSRTDNPLLLGLLDAGHVQRHATGLGLAAEEQRVGEGLYAVGSVLTGQLLETVAVPELRTQAATVAERLAAALGTAAPHP